MKKNIIIAAAMTAMVVGALFVGCATTDTESEVENTQSTDFPYENFTVKFDANTTPEDLTDDESFTYWTTGWDSKKKSSTVTYPATDDAYILGDDVPVPTRKGYYFAGWQTKPVVTDADIVNGVSKYQMFFDKKISDLGEGAIKTKSDKEISDRGLSQEVNYIKDMEGLTEDGTVTFYARWVQAKEISTEEDLRNIKNDLYGAYVLTDDITLTSEWEPIGYYFTNYEYYNEDWWTYSFRGTLDGNGHSIKGLSVTTADVANPGYDKQEGSRWYADGPGCKGAAGLFGAACKATFTNLTLESPSIQLTGDNSFSGDHMYAASLCCFDMGSTLKDITVNNPDIKVDYNDEKLEYAESLFTSVAGIEAGSWATAATGCTVNGGKIDVNVECISKHGGEVYVGGMLGECYSSLKKCKSDVDITVNGKDVSKAKDDMELIVNVGGTGAANAAATTTESKSTIDVKIAKEKGASSVNVGGFTGAQRYQQVSKCDVNADIKTDCKLDPDKGVLNVGAVIGRMDIFYASLILKYADGVKCGCIDNNVNVTYNGSAYDVLIPEEGKLSIDGKTVDYVATKDYKDEETGKEYKENLNSIAEKYGTYLPKEELEKNILYIEVQ